MTDESLRQVLEAMAHKAALVNIYKAEGKYSNIRECPFYSELKGMELTLKLMGIYFDYNYSADLTQITAIWARGILVEV